jgi:glycerophosphoryl diester phosphodiesterase
MGRPLVIAHQGASGLYPSNTLASFRGAVEARADIIEIDVTHTLDDVIVVSHDLHVDKCTNGHGFIPEMTLAEIKRLDAGVRFGAQFAGERIPTLEEALDWAEQNPIRLCIEVKGDTIGRYLRAGRATVEMLQKRPILEKVTLTSFSSQCIQAMKPLEPRLAWGYDPDERHAYTPWEVCAEALACGASFLLFDHRRLSAEIVDEAHQHGFSLWAWTADRPADLHRLIGFGVDAIMTNRPDVLRGLLEAAP